LVALRDHISKYQDPNEAEEHIQELVVHMHHFEEEMGKIRPLSVPELEMYKKMAERVGRPQTAPKSCDD
jgi:hypothetical protein